MCLSAYITGSEKLKLAMGGWGNTVEIFLVKNFDTGLLSFKQKDISRVCLPNSLSTPCSSGPCSLT